MIYRCSSCGTLWAKFPTPRKVVRALARTCPDCTRGKPPRERRPRSKKRGDR